MDELGKKLGKYIQLIKDQEGYFMADLRRFEFFKKYPLNNNIEHIRWKIGSANHPDIRKLHSVDVMAKHILNLEIDARIVADDLTLVQDIANIESDGHQLNFQNFASIYCNSHKPDIYPIYTEEHFDFIKRYIDVYILDIDPNQLNQYTIFKQALDDIIKRYDIENKFNYYEVRKLGWAYLDKVIEEMKKEK